MIETVCSFEKTILDTFKQKLILQYISHLEGTKTLPSVATKMRPLTTYATVHPVTRSATGNINRIHMLGNIDHNSIQAYLIWTRTRTCGRASSTLHQHHHEPIHIPEGKFHSAF